MENMKNAENMHPLTKWVIDRIEKDYKDDIALLIGITGHSTNGDGHDLYPRSWERLENSVNLDDMAILLDSFDRNNLSLLADRSNQLEKTIQGILADHRITLNSYSSVEAFLAERG